MSDYLDRVEAQLSELTEQGAHRRPGGAPGSAPRRAPGSAPRRASGGAPGGAQRSAARRSRAGGPRPPRRRSSEAFALLAAAAVVGAVVAIVLANVHHGKPGRTTTAAGSATTKPAAATPAPPSHTPPPTLPLPAHFAPRSFTAIGELTWWLLGPGNCPSCAAILRTTNGGRSFVAIPAPHASLSAQGSAQSGYSQLRFADHNNGFAYDPDLYATHNGGRTWHAVDVGGNVTGLSISSGQVYATVEPGGGTGRLMRSPVSHDAWSTVSSAGAVGGGLSVQGSQIIIQSGVGTGVGGNVLVSQDGGATFTAHPAPSPGLPCLLDAPEMPVVWALCATGTESGVWRSTDGGADFTLAAGTGTSLQLPNSASFAAASATTAVVGSQQLYRSTNTGALWYPVSVPEISQWAWLGFTDATHGAALGYAGSIAPANERLYYTTDAGQSYHRVPLP